MKGCFICKTENWKGIGEAVRRYVKHCVDGDIQIDVENREEERCYNSYDFLIVPLFEERDLTLKPTGLEIVRKIRGKRNYKSWIFFVVLSDSDIPDYFNPHRVNRFARNIITNPQFGDVDKAVFLGEMVYRDKNQGSGEIINVASLIGKGNNMNLNNFKEKLRYFINLIDKAEEEVSLLVKLRKYYYESFVEFYNYQIFGKIDENGNFYKDLCEFIRELSSSEGVNGIVDKWRKKGLDCFLKFLDAQLFLETADAIYNLLNGIMRSNYDGHRVHIELFRAPLPFPLYELFEAKRKIKEALENGKGIGKIKLLLVDNKTDKFEVINNLFKNFGIDNLFSIEIEKFDLTKFKESAEYKGSVYSKIKHSHFILLDFFLNSDNTYFAFNFIKDINDIKRERREFFTTWYFITSAIYDAAVKYAQSGLLAEYYESAVVNAGDDPCNEKRQIIFVYKLLTFIYSRIKNFKNYWLVIEDWLRKSEECDKKDCYRCLESIMLVARKFQMEWDELHEVFPGLEVSKEEYKDLAVCIEHLIKNFFWRPEADWQLVQLHIEMVNEKLEKINKGKMFSCRYILEEMKKRSEVY